jgi:hypothetical protein
MGRERKAEDPNGRETEDYFLCTSSTPSTKSPIPAKRSDCTAPSLSYAGFYLDSGYDVTQGFN